MQRSLLILAMAVFWAGACRDNEEPEPPTGRELFVRHCATCHGLDGTGNGPVAPSLTTPPPDLTRLAQQDRFDERELMRVIDGRRIIAVHGPQEMPVWGAVFTSELEEEPHTARTALLRTAFLVEYLRTIQKP